jgi:hypothetical protein
MMALLPRWSNGLRGLLRYAVAAAITLGTFMLLDGIQTYRTTVGSTVFERTAALGGGLTLGALFLWFTRGKT